jgi:S1-C subfamily serine protease
MVTSSEETTGTLLGLSTNLADAVEDAGKSIVAVHARRHTPASGVHWRSGVIVTADHVIEREENITVTFPDGRPTTATLAGRDAGSDLAVLKLDAGNLATARIGNADDLRVGHIVLAVARPGDHGLAASWGTVSALGGAFRTWSGGQIDRLIRPDLTLYPGFSGGALVNAHGQIVGINTSGLSRNMTLTIPAATVDRVVEQLLARGRIARGYLGLAMQPVHLPDQISGPLDLASNRGLIVVSVEQGGPAEAAGILVGDILIALDGKPVSDMETLQGLLDAGQIGRQLAVRVIRGGVPADLSLTVGERPWKGQ